MLIPQFADRDDHSATLLELIEQRLRHVIGCTGDDDGVEGRGFGPALVTIAVTHPDVVVAESCQIALGPTCQWLDDFDAVDLTHQTRQDGCLIAGSSTDFEYPVGIPCRQLLGHERDHVGLGNGLVVADR